MTAKVDFEEENITISLEEYKQLLEYKGRYLELKSIYDTEKNITPNWNPTKITWTGSDTTYKTDYPYHYTCGCHHE